MGTESLQQDGTGAQPISSLEYLALEELLLSLEMDILMHLEFQVRVYSDSDPRVLSSISVFLSRKGVGRSQ